MNNSNQLISINEPFGMLTRSDRKDIAQIYSDRNTNQSFYNYLCFDNEKIKELFLQICLMTVEDNISMEGNKDFSSLKKGTFLKKINASEAEVPYFRFKGLTKDTIQLEKLYEDKKDKYDISYMRSKAEEILKPIELYEDRLKSRYNSASIENYRRNLASILSTEVQSYWNTKKSVIIAPNKLIEEMINFEFDFGRKNYRLGQLCNCWRIDDEGTLKKASYSNGYEYPCVILASNLVGVQNYLYGQKNAKNISVYVLGDNWYKGNNVYEFRSLIDLCENRFKLNVISNIYSSFESKDLDLFNYDSLVKIFENNKNITKYSLKAVKCNDQLRKSLTELSEIIDYIEYDRKYIELFFQLKKFVGLLYGQVDRNFSFINQMVQDIAKLSSDLNFKDKDKLNELLLILLNNRYGSQVKKEIKKILSDDSKYLLVVHNDLLEEVNKEYTQYKNVDCVSIKSKPSDVLDYDKVILVSPYSKDRRRWMYSKLNCELCFIVPETNLGFWKRALKKDKKIFTKISKYTEDLNYPRQELERIEKLLKSISLYEKKKENNEPKYRLDKIDEDLYLSIEETEQTEQTHIVTPETDAVNTVSINYKVKLISGKEIFGTEYGTIYKLGNDGRCEKTLISDLSTNDGIIDFSLPYSDEVYRFKLKRRMKKYKDEQIHNIQDIQDMDFYWKYEFIEYVKKRDLTTFQVKERFDKLGYDKKTIGFYSAWLDLNRIPIAPRESEFIKYIGLLIKNNELLDRYKDFYRASKEIKNRFREKRDKKIDNFEGYTLQEIQESKFKSYIDRVKDIEKLTDVSVDRIDTNRII
jgi:hypothetical protein